MGQLLLYIQWLRWLLLLLVLVATMPAAADASDLCACSACQTLVQQEFQPGTVKSCNSTASNASDCEPACAWKLLDIQWCAGPSGNQLYTLTAIGVSGLGSLYTNDCRVCLESGGSCKVEDATGAVHQVASKDIALATLSVALEFYHLLSIVVLKYDEVRVK